MRTRNVRARFGFTLIELLVVVAIIALLISILLPSLAAAREQAKVAKCLAHMKNLNTATRTYLQEHKDHFPYGAIMSGGNETAISSWTYGGMTARIEQWAGTPFLLPVQNRPLNPYIMGGPIEPDILEAGRFVKRTEIPALRCPSDRTTNQHRFSMTGNSNPENTETKGISSYEDVGTSYHYNLHALQGVSINGHSNPWENGFNYWTEVGKALTRQVLMKHSSTFVMYLEDPFDWGISNDSGHVQIVGNHGAFSKHSLGFLDGHAVYRYVDTRTHGGPGWAAINPDWVDRSDRGFPRPSPVRYIGYSKNTDPYYDGN